MCCFQGRIKKFQVMAGHVSSEESDLRKILPLGIDWADVVAALQELPIEELVRIKDPSSFKHVRASVFFQTWKEMACQVG